MFVMAAAGLVEGEMGVEDEGDLGRWRRPREGDGTWHGGGGSRTPDQGGVRDGVSGWRRRAGKRDEGEDEGNGERRRGGRRRWMRTRGRDGIERERRWALSLR